MIVHPYLVHFPVAFFLLEAFLIGLWFQKKEDRYEAFAFLVQKLAVATLPFVMIAGLMDAGGIYPKVRPHFLFALALLFLSVFRLWARIKGGSGIWREPMRKVSIALLALSVVLTVVTAHLGGAMVYQ